YRLWHQCSPHPTLLSFPTRRSSDLPTAPWMPSWPSKPYIGTKEAAAPDLRGGCLFVLSYQKLDITPPAPAGGRAWRPAGPGWRPDRKSTRLNSSHVSTSYAVFCLQK